MKRFLFVSLFSLSLVAQPRAARAEPSAPNAVAC